MIRIDLVIPVAATTADDFFYPVSAVGNVSEVIAVYDQETDLDETITVSRGTTAVNLCTPPADATAEGTSFTGVPDTTNKALLFDPASTTVANRVLKISVPNTFDTAGHLGLSILFDDTAYVEQAALEA